MRMKYLVIVFMLFSVTACDYFTDYIVHNNSQQYIIETPYLSVYPDTVIRREKEPQYCIPPSEVDISGFQAKSMKEVYASYPTDTISYFILSPDTIAKYGWEDVRKNYRILKRYDLSYGDMESLDFNIYYPPTPAMRYMKMYPPYE